MGKYSKQSLEMTKELGYKTIFWSFAYKDWLVNSQPSESYAIEKITNGGHPGCIMLLHAVSITNTNVLKTVIESLKADGYVFKSLDYLDNSNETEAEAQAKFNYAPQKILAQQYTTINQ